MARTDNTDAVTEATVVEAPAETVATVTDAPEADSVPSDITDGNTATADESAFVADQEAAEAAADTAEAEAEAAKLAAEAEALATANQATFEAALKSAIDGRDANSGDIPKELFDATLAAYRELNATQKKAAKQAAKDGMGDALRKHADAGMAKAYMDLGDAFSNTRATPEGPAKAAVNPTDAFVDARLAHYFASEFVVPPADLAADWSDRMKAKAGELKAAVADVKAYQTLRAAWDAASEHADGETEPTLPESTPEVLRIALKLASGGTARKPRAASGTGTSAPRAARAASSYTGARRSIAEHIAKWAASVPVGTVAKHGEVARFASSEYPAGDASSGAVTAFMDRGNFGAIKGVTIEAATTADGKKAIKRTA